ncbi:MAG TPA: winged helix DNA-binding domain-containing protein [Candidatus Dormibacteraeota bacterium]
MSHPSARPLRLARMRAQRLTDATRLGPDPAAITRAICAVQAQSFDAARHQLRVRSVGLTAGAVDRAFEQERAVVRTWLMRGTLHLCAADDLRWMLSVLGPNSNRLAASRRVGLGLDDATCQRGVEVLRKALAHGPLARRQLRRLLVASRVINEPVGQMLIHLLFHAATLGVICSGPRMGRDDSFVMLDDWVPASDGPRGETALVELARRYLAAYGPASVADFAAWSGLPSDLAKAGMAGVGAGMVGFPGPIPGLWTLGPVAPEPRSSRPVVRLLGHFDTFLLGYRRREHVGDAAAEAWIHQGGGGWIRPVICVDGWIVAGWRLDARGSGFELTVIPFVALSGRVEAGIDREVVSISQFLERPVRWTSEALVG